MLLSLCFSGVKFLSNYFQALQKIDSLSGGQKSRVAFAVLCGHGPNFLIMDEPTNHLDIQTIEALGHALCEYKASSRRCFANF